MANPLAEQERAMKKRKMANSLAISRSERLADAGKRSTQMPKGSDMPWYEKMYKFLVGEFGAKSVRDFAINQAKAKKK